VDQIKTEPEKPGFYLEKMFRYHYSSFSSVEITIIIDVSEVLYWND